MARSRRLRTLGRAFDPGDPYGSGHLRVVHAATRVRLVLGLGIAVVVLLVPSLELSDRLLLAGLVAGYVMAATVIDAVAERHLVGTRVINLMLGFAAAFLCGYLVPELFPAVLLAYTVAVVIDTCLAGLHGGVEASVTSVILAFLGQWALPPEDRLSSSVLLLFVVFLVVVVLMVDTMTRERRRAATDLERLQEALRSVTAAPGLVPTLDSIAEQVSATLECVFAAVLLRDGDNLRLAAPTAALPSDDTERFRTDTASPVTAAVLEDRPVLVDDIEHEDRFPQWHDTWHDRLVELQIQSVAAVPLRAGGEVVGALFACFPHPGALDDGELRMLQAWADQAALVIVRAQAYEQEKEATARLQEADRIKAEFLATVSHELRTPLTAAKGFVDTVLLHWDRLDDEQRQLMLSRASLNADALSRQIEQLLDLTRIDAGKVEILPEDIELGEVIGDALVGLAPVVAHRHVLMTVPPDLWARVDREAFGHVLANLLSNAVKFSDEGSVIEVGARRSSGAEIEVWVRDEGIGVAPEERERIFERFYQARPGDRPRRGAGIGLAVVQRFVELHGGRVWVEDAPGGGSTFRFTLPASAARRSAPSPAEAGAEPEAPAARPDDTAVAS